MVRRRALVIGGVVAAAAAMVGNTASGRPVEHLAYWWWRDHTAPAQGSLRVALLGDSSMLGTGASRPADSLAGRTVTHLAAATGRPVHARNASNGGGGVRDVVDRQVTASRVADADVVLVSVGSNDAAGGYPLSAFADAVAELLAALPQERTVLCDIAVVPGVEPYQAIWARSAQERGFRRAPFREPFEAAQRRDVMAMDGHHLSSIGYGIWFEGVRPVLDEVVRAGR